MMRPLSPQQLASLVNGELESSCSWSKQITSVGIDARKLQPNSLFVGLPGSKQHGRAFLAQAAQQGAVAALVEDWQPNAAANICQIKVASSSQALQQLAQKNRQEFQQPLIAVTGNSGKTTVKEMLAAILRAHWPEVLATEGNLNNHLGVPLTLLRLEPQQQAAVIELGANHLGEIQQLASWAQPDIGIITNVTGAHLGEFGSLENIATAKAELLAGLAPTATAVLNAEDAFYSFWQQKLQSKAISFGWQQADVCASELSLDKLGGFNFEVKSPWGQQSFNLPLLGKHNVANALAAISAAGILGVPLSVQAQALANLEAPAGRLSRLAGKNGAVILDDSYNASPGAVQAALEVLASHSGRKILALGGLAELGAHSQTVHTEIGQLARQLGINRLFALEGAAATAAAAFGAGGISAATHAELAAAIEPELDADTWLLVKGARSSGMDTLVDLLKK